MSSVILDKSFMGMYRGFIYWLHCLHWCLFKKKHKYKKNDIVFVRIRTILYGEMELLCRITECNYRLFQNCYDVIIIDVNSPIPYGTRTYVLSDNILRLK
jgi:hypothetical protein